jgi:hypothetical protein
MKLAAVLILYKINIADFSLHVDDDNDTGNIGLS